MSLQRTTRHFVPYLERIVDPVFRHCRHDVVVWIQNDSRQRWVFTLPCRLQIRATRSFDTLQPFQAKNSIKLRTSTRGLFSTGEITWASRPTKVALHVVSLVSTQHHCNNSVLTFFEIRTQPFRTLDQATDLMMSSFYTTFEALRASSTYLFVASSRTFGTNRTEAKEFDESLDGVFPSSHFHKKR